MGVAQGAFYANGHRVAGCDLTINNGMFIDTNNEITSGTYSEDLTYTATEDCFFTVVATCKASGSGITSYLSIDDVEVCSFINPNQDQRFSVYAKAGQVIKVHESGTTTNGYAVYGIQEGAVNGPKVTTYHGVPVTANIYDDGYCNLTKVEFDDFILYNLDFTVHIKGTSTGVEFLPFYTFDSGVLDDIDWRSMLTYCVYNDTYFARVRTKKEVNALGGYYGNFTISDGWYSCTPTTFLVQKNQPSS